MEKVGILATGCRCLKRCTAAKNDVKLQNEPKIKGKIRLYGMCSFLVAVGLEFFSRYDVQCILLDV